MSRRTGKLLLQSVSAERLLTRSRTAYNFTGSHEAIYNQFVAPLQAFDVTPTEVSKVG